MPKNRRTFMNTYIDDITLEEALDYIKSCIESKKIGQVITPNVDQIVRLEWDTYFQKICENSELMLVDGQPLMWIARFYKRPFQEKICGSDLMLHLCQMAQKNGFSVFLLGAAPGIAKKAAQNLRILYPKLNIAGTYSPPIGFEKDDNEISRINDILKNSRADMLFVGMGVPKQDIFIYENMNTYQIPMSFSIGGTIDFIAGKQKRAPKWINRLGFEWFYRCIHNPKRLFKRYFVDDLKVFSLLIKYRKISNNKR